MNMELTKPITNAFWELLRCGIWDSAPDITLFGSLTIGEWEGIYGLVRKHAVIGVTFSVLEKLPVGLRPGRKLYLKWCGMTLQIKSGNQQMNKVYGNLKHWFEQAGIYPILMKGLGIAALYPQPLLRMAGDIDIYIMKQDYLVVVDMIRKAGFELKQTAEHDEFVFQNVQVELHTYTSYYGSIFENAQRVDFISDRVSTYRIPSAETNALLLIKHPAKHLFTSGSAIRHLCDWTLFLQQNHGRISFDSIEDKLKSEGFDHFAMVFTALAVEYLGLSQTVACQDWLDKSKKKQEEILLNDLMDKGDCGINDWNHRLSIGQFSFSWMACREWVKYYGKTFFRLMKLSALFPGVIRKMLVGRIGRRLRLTTTGRPFASC